MGGMRTRRDIFGESMLGDVFNGGLNFVGKFYKANT
jgi:hypothetical protein